MATLIEVFEHETVRVHDTLRVIQGSPTQLSQHTFDALARYNDAHGGDLFKMGHQRFTVTQHVGYVEVGGLAMEILPKADRSALRGSEAPAWRDGLLDMLRVALGLQLRAPSPAAQRVGQATLLELVVARFLEDVQKLLRQGLCKGYREQEENTSRFRGQLRVQKNIQENLVRPDRFYVRFSEYDVDILINRIIRAALDVVSGLALSPSCLARVCKCRFEFPEVSRLGVAPDLFERLRLHRATVRYADALTAARLILHRHSPQLRSGEVPVFALLFNMNALWERYVSALMRRVAGPGVHVSAQESRGFWKQVARRSRTVRPDVVVRAGKEVVLVADAKWKLPQDGAPADADLKQMFAYNELFGSQRSLLVYPTAVKREGCAGRYVGREHACETVHIHLHAGESASWNRKAIEEQLRVAMAGPSAAPQELK